MLRGALFLLLVLASLGTAQADPPGILELYGPSPSPRENEGSQPQTKSANGEERSANSLEASSALPDQNKPAPDALKGFDYTNPDWWVAAFSGLLFFIAVGQLIVFGRQATRLRETVEAMKEAEARQSRDTEATIAVSKTAAEAAKKSAEISERALTVLERPYVFFQDTDERQIAPPTMVREFDLIFRNYGKAPALVVSVRIGCSRQSIPPNPKEAGKLEELPSGAVIGPGEAWPRGRVKLNAGELPAEESDYLHGQIVYRDLFGKEWSTWFCRRFLRKQFILANLNDQNLNGHT